MWRVYSLRDLLIFSHIITVIISIVNDDMLYAQTSDMIMSSYGRRDLFVEFLSLQYSLYMSCFVCVLGGAFFLATALFIQRDREQAEKMIKGWL